MGRRKRSAGAVDGPGRLFALTPFQSTASNPVRNIWLSARSGTGRTFVSAARIWRLLLAGVLPDAILCLTQSPTEAAAISHMVIRQAAKWAHDESSLHADLSALYVDNTPRTRLLAKGVLPTILDRSFGGLRIETFTDFAARLVAEYPFEAGLVPAFRLLDEEEQARLRRQAFADLQANANREGRVELTGAIAALTQRLGAAGADDFLAACVRHADAMEELPATIGPWLHALMGLGDPAEADRNFAGFLAQTLEAGREFALLYGEAKRRIGSCDRNEILGRALSFLEDPATGEWARYQLDQGTHHILISDAQDCDWRHWRLVRAIADEFFAGEGAHEAERTLFVSGDEHAAIGDANPVFYEAARRHFYSVAAHTYDQVAHISPMDCYRSATAVVQFIQTAMEELPEPGTGIVWPVDHPIIGTMGRGQVILLPHQPAEPPETLAHDPIRAQAMRIIALVQSWLASSDMLESTGCPARPEDVAILFKRGGKLAQDVISGLQDSGIPIIDESRLSHGPPPAIAALLAAGRFALHSENDQALASLISSPLLEWDYGAGGTGPDALAAALHDLPRLAGETTPHQFFEHILSGAIDGRRVLCARLGESALEEIDLLIGEALAFQKSNAPSLPAFLDAFEQRGDALPPVDSGRPAVRVALCERVRDRHFPLVLLADATDPRLARERDFIMCRLANSDLEIPIVLPDAHEQSGKLAAHFRDAAMRAREEDWRLFYVAITSASERLAITGLPIAEDDDDAGESWYAAAECAFDALGVPGDRDKDRLFEGRLSQDAPQPTAPGPARLHPGLSA